MQIDLVTHDVKKFFFFFLLKRNGYALEQLFSPLILHTTPEHDELKALAVGCVTRNHVHHYLGFGESQWGLFEKEQSRRVKPLLYVFRVLLTGIHMMRSGVVEANLQHLNEEFQLPYLEELVARKLAGTEASVLDDAELGFYRGEYIRLRTLLEEASRASELPDAPTCKYESNDLLLRIRLQGLPGYPNTLPCR